MARKKKEDVFYTMLKELAELVNEAAEEYAGIIHSFPSTDAVARIPQMKTYETTCDDKVKAIMEQLYTAFITPIDREYIADLALAMDDVVDGMNNVATRFELFDMEDMRVEVVQIADLTVAAVGKLKETVDSLPQYKKNSDALNHSLEVSKFEDEADTVYERGLYNLFHEEDNKGKYYLTWLRILDRMESVVDSCDHASSIVRSVTLEDA